MNAIINLQQLSEQISALTGASHSTTELFIKELFATISEALSKGESVTIKGLGAFRISEYPEKTVLFAPDNDLAESINLPFSCFEAIELHDDINFEENIEDTASFDDEIIPDSNIKENESTEINQPVADEKVDNTNQDSSVEELETEDVSQTIEHNLHEESFEQENSETDIIEDVECPEIPSLENKTETQISEENTSEPESKKWIWYIVLLSFLCFIVGYLIGSIYPYHKFVETNSVAPTTQDTIVNDSFVDNESDSVPTIAIDSLRIDTVSLTVPQSQITDTVSTNRFLTTMSREYYGEMIFWVYIYEENKDILSNPNRIKPGTVVKIPPAEKYNINRNDSTSLSIAKLKAMEIYAPYQK